ncbi:hypothetical protein HanPI659440_Chr11g0409961 [Helianthus annuus]|nr:hypothetical protein HanPI659440_Chr11g0409961 [Helianthus annuus]
MEFIIQPYNMLIYHFLSDFFKHSHPSMIPNIINIIKSSIYITLSKTHFITSLLITY